MFSSGKVKQGNESDLVECLETKEDSAVANTPSVKATVMEGAAVVYFFQFGTQLCKIRTYYSYNIMFLELGHVWDVGIKDREAIHRIVPWHVLSSAAPQLLYR